MEHCVNVYLLAFVAILVVHTLLPVPEGRDDVHVRDNISEVKWEFDDLDRALAFSFDEIRDLDFDILSCIPLVVFEGLSIDVSSPRDPFLTDRDSLTAAPVTTTVKTFLPVMMPYCDVRLQGDSDPYLNMKLRRVPENRKLETLLPESS